MTDADPLTGATAYEVLGVFREDSLDRIESQMNRLVQEYQERMVDAERREDTGDYNEAVDALTAIDDAWEWIQENHEQPSR